MKKITLYLFSILLLPFISLGQKSENLQGAFLSSVDNKQILWLFVDKYFSQIVYSENKYIATKGGPFTFDGKQLNVHLEYDDEDPTQVGTNLVISVRKNQENLKQGQELFERQASKQQALDGLWRITGRQQGATRQEIQRGDRKTIKILVDGYFQWIAINPAQKGFYGTGGGLYSFINSTYTEHILFFSRDNSRVGNELNFNGEIIDGAWHHHGKSSKGDPIHEIWSRDN